MQVWNLGVGHSPLKDVIRGEDVKIQNHPQILGFSRFGSTLFTMRNAFTSGALNSRNTEFCALCARSAKLDRRTIVQRVIKRGNCVQASSTVSQSSAGNAKRNIRELSSEGKKALNSSMWTKDDEKNVRRVLQDADRGKQPLHENGRVLLGSSVDMLQTLAEECGEAPYRGKQLQTALLKGARTIKSISNIPKRFREELINKGVKSGRSKIFEVRKSPDGTHKFLLQLFDGRVVETVGIPADRSEKTRLTVCLSSQVGCPLKCSFCATGKGGFSRNLMPHEIIDQVLTVQEEMSRRVSNIVFMGMGEPLLNLKSVMQAHEFINKEIGIGARNITISTVGVPNTIRKLAEYKTQSTLAVSLHAPTQKLREQLIPSAKVYGLDALMEDCLDYFNTTGRRVTFEYTAMAGVNDTPLHALQLCQLLDRYNLKSHVNLIPWNPVGGMDFNRPSRQSLEEFIRILEKRNITASVRVSRGLDAAAACGQLSNEFQKKPLEDYSALE